MVRVTKDRGVSVFDVECPICKAPAGKQCKAHIERGRTIPAPRYPHPARYTARRTRQDEVDQAG